MPRLASVSHANGMKLVVVPDSIWEQGLRGRSRCIVAPDGEPTSADEQGDRIVLLTFLAFRPAQDSPAAPAPHTIPHAPKTLSS